MYIAVSFCVGSLQFCNIKYNHVTGLRVQVMWWEEWVWVMWQRSYDRYCNYTTIIIIIIIWACLYTCMCTVITLYNRQNTYPVFVWYQSTYMYIGHFEFCKHDETRSTKDNAITNNHHICCVCYKHVYYFRTYCVLFT